MFRVLAGFLVMFFTERFSASTTTRSPVGKDSLYATRPRLPHVRSDAHADLSAPVGLTLHTVFNGMLAASVEAESHAGEPWPDWAHFW